MSERENILTRIREALTAAAPKPGAHPAQPATAAATPWASFPALLPAVGNSFAENVALFQKNTQELKADFHLVNSLEELCSRLQKLGEAEGWKRVGSHHGPLTDAACGALGLPVCRVDLGYQVNELESCDAGLTECDALIAHTGSVLITSRSAGGRALSVLPPHHVVLARRAQLLGGLPEAFGLLKEKYAPNYPSLISFISGPSRTGDIERILVLGAHGPKKLTIFCY